ncbi:MAG: SdpI family protein [Candidatus Aenigmarchaeota archaeon]|nr:SdpI family protein [Candidatus Aenigmarchaeota archaeon]
MKLNKSELFLLILLLISFIISLYFYPQLPDEMASHWNAQGEVDGYMSKFWGLFLLPFILTGLALLFIAIPRIDPLKENIEKSRKYYNGFIIIFFIFMLLIQIHIILWNLGTKISLNLVLPVLIGIMFYYIGGLLENIKRNWFIGIRTPWTMSNEKVWDKTHKLAGKLFRLAGIIAFMGIFFPDQAIYFIIIPAILIALYTIIYSYLEFQKQLKK